MGNKPTLSIEIGLIASGFAEAISDIDLFGGRDPKVWYKYLVVNRLYVEVKYTHVK